MVKSGIYKITNEKNGKFYIGSSKNIEQRFCEHKMMLGNNKHANIILQRSWNKHGQAGFTFSIVEECFPDKCIEREQYYLDLLQPFKSVGYNIGKSACGGDNITDHPNREAFVEKMKQVTAGNCNGMFGKTHSDVSIKKQKNAAIGRYSLGWFINKYGATDGPQKYQERRTALANRKINYKHDNGLKGTTIEVESTRGASVSKGRNALKGKMPEFLLDISNVLLSTKQIADKYGISTTAIKYHRKKVNLSESS